VELPSGTEIQITMPGFICRMAEPQLRSPLDFISNDYQKFTPKLIYSQMRYVAAWDQSREILTLRVHEGSQIERG
jgi:hypothetical protein